MRGGHPFNIIAGTHTQPSSSPLLGRPQDEENLMPSSADIVSILPAVRAHSLGNTGLLHLAPCPRLLPAPTLTPTSSATRHVLLRQDVLSFFYFPVHSEPDARSRFLKCVPSQSQSTSCSGTFDGLLSLPGLKARLLGLAFGALVIQTHSYFQLFSKTFRSSRDMPGTVQGVLRTAGRIRKRFCTDALGLGQPRAPVALTAPPAPSPVGTVPPP